MVGTDPNEWWADYATIIKIFKTQLKEMSGIQVIAGNPQAYHDGNFGWVADRPKLRLPDGKEIPLRQTGVFLKGRQGLEDRPVARLDRRAERRRVRQETHDIR